MHSMRVASIGQAFFVVVRAPFAFTDHLIVHLKGKGRESRHYFRFPFSDQLFTPYRR